MTPLAAARPELATSIGAIMVGVGREGFEMLTKYIKAAMGQARYEILPDDGTFYGSIPGFQGVWTNAPSEEACREELEEVLEEWVLFSVSRQLPLPAVDGIELTTKEVA